MESKSEGIKGDQRCRIRPATKNCGKDERWAGDG